MIVIDLFGQKDKINVAKITNLPFIKIVADLYDRVNGNLRKNVEYMVNIETVDLSKIIHAQAGNGDIIINNNFRIEMSIKTEEHKLLFDKLYKTIKLIIMEHHKESLGMDLLEEKFPKA
jgi:hypothetical protein